MSPCRAKGLAAPGFCAVPGTPSSPHDRYTQEVHKLIFNVLRSEIHTSSVALAGVSEGGPTPGVGRQLEVIEVSPAGPAGVSIVCGWPASLAVFQLQSSHRVRFAQSLAELLFCGC